MVLRIVVLLDNSWALFLSSGGCLGTKFLDTLCMDPVVRSMIRYVSKNLTTLRIGVKYKKKERKKGPLPKQHVLRVLITLFMFWRNF